MSNEGPGLAAPRGSPDCLKVPVRSKAALALWFDEGSGNAYDVRLELTKEALTVQRQDIVCVGGGHPDANHRTVTLRRQPVGGLGLGIKGGAEYCLPVIISRIFKDQAAACSGMLFVGDAILQVNGVHVENATHKEVVHLLRTAGDEVTVTVEYLRDAPSFLKLPLGSLKPSNHHSSPVSSLLFDSGLHLNRHGCHTGSLWPSSPTADEPRYEKRWLDVLSVSLRMARLSRFRAGQAEPRCHAFEVLALDGASTGILQFHRAQECLDWLYAVSANISHLMLQHMQTANQSCPPCDQVVHMGWVSERPQGADASRTLRPRFLALKGPSFYIFSTPPTSTLDWGQAERVHDLCEVLVRVHKFWLLDDRAPPARLHLGLRDLDLEGERPYRFSVLASHGRSYSFTVELGTELAVWEKAFHRATFMEVQRRGSRTYTCSWQGEGLCFTVDFALGFACVDSKTKNLLWRFQFSQLKGSSDDGKTRVKLLFQNPDTKQIEVKELEFPDLAAVLHCIHSFLAARVASVDPKFLDRQSIAGRRVHSS
ncbi:gamma-2-syntrophin [Ctenodactylus gundi]